jgi:hypothetical protein
MKRQHLSRSRMTAGAAMIVPYMYSEVTIETTKKDTKTLNKNPTFIDAVVSRKT